MPVDREVSALAASLQEQRDRETLRKRRLSGIRDRTLAYRRLFFGDDGKLRADAVIVLNDLGEAANFGRVIADASDAELRMNEGRRHLMLHIFDRFDLDGERMARLASELRETKT